MNCEIPIPRLPRDDSSRVLGAVSEQVKAEFPKLFVRLRLIDVGEKDEVTVVTPAPVIAPGEAVPIMSLDDVADHTRIKERVTAIRDEALRAVRGS